jgi:uncharacterized membrane protein HdeD (DUF308 family)
MSEKTEMKTMKTNKNTAESMIYTGACILSFGIICLIRVVITMAIRKAMVEEK